MPEEPQQSRKPLTPDGDVRDYRAGRGSSNFGVQEDNDDTRMRITRIRQDPHWHYEVRLAPDGGAAELQHLGRMIRQLRCEAWPFLVGGSREAPDVALFVGPLSADQALAFEREWPEQLR